MRPRLATVLACLAGALGAGPGAGCAGGTPQPARVKAAARSWARARLHPPRLMVTLVVVTPDERRGRVRLKAGDRSYDVRLVQRDGSWHVVSARRR